MLSDCFEISVDLARRILRLRVWGFWTCKQAECYRSRMLEAMETLGKNPWRVLADVRRFPVQMKSVQKIHCELMQHSFLNGMICSANVVGGVLTKVQIQRMSAEVWPEKDKFAYFTTENEAEAWLEGELNVTDKEYFQQLAETV